MFSLAYPLALLGLIPLGALFYYVWRIRPLPALRISSTKVFAQSGATRRPKAGICFFLALCGMTLLILALCRIMLPHALMPSTTALGTAESDGRKLGVLAGCNVVMPNLSPAHVRKKYMLYNNKAGTDLTAQEGIAMLRRQMEEIGYEVVIGRGDFRKENTK